MCLATQVSGRIRHWQEQTVSCSSLHAHSGQHLWSAVRDASAALGANIPNRMFMTICRIKAATPLAREFTLKILQSWPHMFQEESALCIAESTARNQSLSIDSGTRSKSCSTGIEIAGQARSVTWMSKNWSCCYSAGPFQHARNAAE